MDTFSLQNEGAKRSSGLKALIIEIVTILSLIVLLLFVFNYFKIINFSSFFSSEFSQPEQVVHTNVTSQTVSTASTSAQNSPVEQFKLFSKFVQSGLVKQATLDITYRATINDIASIQTETGESQYRFDLKVGDNSIPLQMSKVVPSIIQDSIDGKTKDIKVEDLKNGDLIEIEYKVDLHDANTRTITEYKILLISSNTQ